MDVEPFDADRDLSAAERIWEECRWVEDEDDKAAMAHFIGAATAHVARLDGEAECLVTTMPGSIRYQDVDLPLSVVTSVTTSLVGRRQQLAGHVLGAALDVARHEGAAVAVLGMFEQGYYDRFGFGTGTYDHQLTLDPASLRVDVPYRRPVRLTVEDWEDVHTCLRTRAVGHGGVRIDPAGFTRAEMQWTETPFGLGHRDADGVLTHLIWGEGKGEHGPFTVKLLAHRTGEQLLELLGLLRSLGDQVRSVKLGEPPGIQLQDLVRHVGRQEHLAPGSPHGFAHTAGAWWQARILDLAACVGARRHDGPPVRFALELVDPLEEWGVPGLGGRYEVTLGPESTIAPTTSATPARASHPALRATVNAFTRLWLGVRPATALALTDRLEAPPRLLADLDTAFADLPEPQPGMDF